ncbi:Ferrous iron transport protein [Fervidicoccus fontis Kam940]|uniref:Ferrous iron transport protein B n=2 Tax=Fervidicoccus fontis TaxID=683846 RepID=I0A1D1_FERFK|nr:Ferrous iron transport protein [Fervidicoccus fontis Kam940]
MMPFNAKEENSKEFCNFKILVAGSPNVGKSTFFNTVTGESVSVANWPGTTVEKKEGRVRYNGNVLCFSDLPGTYNLSSFSPEESITLENILNGKWDAILILVDSLDLIKSLYFAAQVLELYSNAILAFTKSDITHSKGIHIRYDGIQRELGVPLIPISSLTKSGIDELLKEILSINKSKKEGSLNINYLSLEPFIKELENALIPFKSKLKWRLRWIAIKLLEQDELVEKYVLNALGSDEIKKKAEELIKKYIENYNRTPREVVISRRYDFVEKIVKENVAQKAVEKKPSMIERIFFVPVLGFLFSILIYFTIFAIAFTINIGFPLNVIFKYVGLEKVGELLENYSLSGIISEGFNRLSATLFPFLSLYVPNWIASLICDGIIPGVGAVLSFLPLIMTTYALLGVLEDSGLGIRIALSFDRFFKIFGLTGRSLFPLTLSLGCNVPGVLSTRSLEDKNERLSLIYSVPFVPCQARLVIIMAFVSVFFTSPILGASVMVSIYAISILIALLSALLIRRFILKSKEPSEMIAEVPPIHKPIVKVIWWHVWDNSKHFLKKAGTIIFALSIVVWFLLNFSPSGNYAPSIEDSIASYIGSFLSPIGKMYGMNDVTAWKTAFLFETGIVAKEGFLETSVLLSGGNVSVNEAISALGYSAPQAYAVLLAATLYVPCIATLSVLYSETKSIKGVVAVTGYMINVAIVVSFISYKLLSLFV